MISYGSNGTIKSTDDEELSNFVYIIMEYGGKTLLEYTQKYSLGERQAKHIFKQLLNVLKYMGKNNICHRDIKLENILIDKKLNIKLIDFGLACELTCHKLHDFCGTQVYMSPGQENLKCYDGKKNDIFACSVVLFALVAGHFPWERASFDCTFYKLLIENPTKYWKEIDCDGLSPDFKDLFQNMSCYNGINRPTV